MAPFDPYTVNAGGVATASFNRDMQSGLARGRGLNAGSLFLVVDLFALGLSAVTASAATVFFEQKILGVPGYLESPAVVASRHGVFLALCLVQFAMYWSKGLYSGRTPWWSQVQYIGKVALLLLLLDGFLSFALRLSEPRLLIASTWAFAFGSTVVMRWAASQAASRYGMTKLPTVIIADNATATDLIYAFNADPCAGYDVQSVLLRDRDPSGFDLTNLPAACRSVRVHNGLMDCESYISHHRDAFYVISLDSFRGETRERLMKTLTDNNVAYGIVPSISGVGLYEMEPRYFFGHDVMLLQPRAPRTMSIAVSKALKRGLDLFVSGLALLLLSPLMLLVAVMLKLEGQGGSIFYGGKRMGKGGHSFSCWKFRSMEPESDYLLEAYLNENPGARADWDKYRKLPRDPRVTTKTARLIRKLSIDELPQLWNVFSGDMSLVGPRPILHDEVSYFGDALKEYTSVRPGLTGLWQVSGRNATSFLRRVYWDRWYVRNWSLWGDIVILIKTPIVLLTRHGAS